MAQMRLKQLTQLIRESAAFVTKGSDSLNAMSNLLSESRMSHAQKTELDEDGVFYVNAAPEMTKAFRDAGDSIERLANLLWAHSDKAGDGKKQNEGK